MGPKFWSSLLGGSDKRQEALRAQEAAQQRERQLQSVREALTDLVFQKKKVGDQLQALDNEALELKADVQLAARDNRDGPARDLLARLEAVRDEHALLSGQVAALDNDIAAARATEQQLTKDSAG